jgi:hypothetical protein
MISARSLRVGQGGFWAGLLLACCGMSAMAQEAAVMKRAAELRESPSEAARSMAPLAADAPVTRLGERSGAWVQVRNAAGATGWVHMFDVRPAGGAGSGNAASGALRGVTSLFTSGGTQRATSPTSTIGIRGLGAQDIAQAQPNPAAVTQMEGLRQSESQARQFASAAAWASTSVPALAEPARPAAAGATPGNPGQMP